MLSVYFVDGTFTVTAEQIDINQQHIWLTMEHSHLIFEVWMINL